MLTDLTTFSDSTVSHTHLCAWELGENLFPV